MSDVREYRLAPTMLARLIAGYLVVLAVLVFAATALVASLGWSGDLLVVLLALGLVGLFAAAAWLRGKAYVVRVDDDGYRVRLIRGAGVKEGRWVDVESCVAAFRHDLPCVVLRLRDGRTTTIPVDAVAGDREAFADDVRARLERAAGRAR